MNATEVENDGTANANWGTLIIVLIVIAVSLTISFVAFNANASGAPVSATPQPLVPVASPGPATNYSAVPGQTPQPKATP